jgi:hypothetical protein
MPPTQSTQVMTFAMLMELLSAMTNEQDQVKYVESCDMWLNARTMTVLQVSELEKKLKPLAQAAWKAQKELIRKLLENDVSYLVKELSRKNSELAVLTNLEELQLLQEKVDHFTKKFSASDTNCGGFIQLKKDKDLLCAQSKKNLLKNLSEDDREALVKKCQTLHEKQNKHSLHWNRMVAANGDLMCFIDELKK